MVPALASAMVPCDVLAVGVNQLQPGSVMTSAQVQRVPIQQLRATEQDARSVLEEGSGVIAKRLRRNKDLLWLVQQHNSLKPRVRPRPTSRVSTARDKLHTTRRKVAPKKGVTWRAKSGKGSALLTSAVNATTILQEVNIGTDAGATVTYQELAEVEEGCTQSASVLLHGASRPEEEVDVEQDGSAPQVEQEVAAVRGAVFNQGRQGLNVTANDFTPTRVQSPAKVPVRVIKVLQLGVSDRSRGSDVKDSSNQAGYKVRVPSGLPSTAPLETRWQEQVSDVVTDTLIVRGRWGNTDVRMLYDTGSQAQLVNGSLVKRLRTSTVPTVMQLQFGDGSTSAVSQITTKQAIHIQDGVFYERFLVTAKDIPGVDIILGQGFAKRSGARVIWPKQGSADVPFLLFKDGTRWYGEDVVGTTSVPLIHTINAKQTEQFVKACKGDFTLMAVSLEEILSREEASKCSPASSVDPLLQVVLDEFPDIFRDDLPMDLPTQRQDQPNSIHHIPLIEGATPVKVRTLPMSHGQRLLLAELLKELLDKGYISPAPDNSQWSAPIFLLKKGEGNKPGPVSGNWRVITDFRALNALTKPSVYVPPSVREVLDSLVHKKVFSRSDNLSGFYQAALAEEDRVKTTFTCFTPEGFKKSYYFNVSCLGLQGAPSSYQLFMEDVIAGIPDVVCYIDDLAYASNTMEEHADLLRVVFTRLRKNQVYLNASKCRWGLAGMDFLGMHVSHNRVRISDDKVQGLTEYPVPKSFEDLRRFVGFANYVGQFVSNFSTQIVGLTDMLKQQAEKKKKFVWTNAAQLEFDGVREKLIASAGLVIPDLRGEFVLETDASGLGMGAVLFQFLRGPEEGAGRLVPVWFMSRKFNNAEVHYNTRDREALAVTWALLKCKQYLLLTDFVLYSDHESLAGFKVQPGLKGKDWRHQEIVGEFDFAQRYRAGALLVAPDALSRAFDDRVISNTVWSEVDHTLHGAALPVRVALVVRPAGVLKSVRWDASIPPDQVKVSGQPLSTSQSEILSERVRSVHTLKPPRIWRKEEWAARLQDMALCPVPRSWRSLQQFISRVAVFKDRMPDFRERIAACLTLWRNRRHRDVQGKWREDPFKWSPEAEHEFRFVCWDLTVLGGMENVSPVATLLARAALVRAAVQVAPARVLEPEVVVPPAPAFVGIDIDAAQEQYAATLLEVHGDVEGTTTTGSWRGDVREAYSKDELYGPIVTLCGRSGDTLTLQERTRIRHYQVVDDILYFAPRGAGETRLCVPVSPGNALRLVMLYDSHETGVHGGVAKTYARLAARFYWPGMLNDVQRYIWSCRSCRLNKSRTRSEVGALGGLPIPVDRWHTVGMDWITDLPVTRMGHDAVLVVEDSLTKFAYFLAAKKTDTAQDAAKRVFASVFCVHGAPHTIVSDRDKLFTSKFFGALMGLMHVKQAMGTSHYHDFNGAVECLNKTVEVMLRHLLSEFPERDFDDLLPMVQWAYNTSVHSTTGSTPYWALYGVNPREPMNLVAAPTEKVPPAVEAFVAHQAGVLAMTRDALYKSQATMLEYENRRRREPELQVGDYVYLSTVNLGKTHFTTTVAKLQQRFVGPYLIKEKRSDYKFLLDLPGTLRSVYPVFHAALLWKALPTPPDMVGRLGAGVSLPPIAAAAAAQGNAGLGNVAPGEGTEALTHDDAGVPVYVIEKVLERRQEGRGYQYLVKWIGFDDPVNNSWISRHDAATSGAARALANFDLTQAPVVVAMRGKAPAAMAKESPVVQPSRRRRRRREQQEDQEELIVSSMSTAVTVRAVEKWEPPVSSAISTTAAVQELAAAVVEVVGNDSAVHPGRTRGRLRFGGRKARKNTNEDGEVL